MYIGVQGIPFHTKRRHWDVVEGEVNGLPMLPELITDVKDNIYALFYIFFEFGKSEHERKSTKGEGRKYRSKNAAKLKRQLILHSSLEVCNGLAHVKHPERRRLGVLRHEVP